MEVEDAVFYGGRRQESMCLKRKKTREKQCHKIPTTPRERGKTILGQTTHPCPQPTFAVAHDPQTTVQMHPRVVRAQ